MHGNNASPRLAIAEAGRLPEDESSWSFRLVGTREQPPIKRFIASSFAAAYGARLESFMPQLAALYRGRVLLAACGLRPALDDRLFLETYFDRPIEHVLAEATARRIERRKLVEVGNLAIARAGAARVLIVHLTEHLLAQRTSYAVFTMVPALRNNFARLGIPLYRLGEARADLLPPPLRADWGTYYEQRPAVTAVCVEEAAGALRLTQ